MIEGVRSPTIRTMRGTRTTRGTLRLSVIVPATDRPATLERCAAAIRAASAQDDELVAVEEPADANPARARNLGAARADGDVLVFVDADVELHRDALESIRSVFASDPELDAVFGSYDDAPAAPGVVSAFRNLLHHHVHHSARGAATTFWTGLGAVRREAFESLGGFDEGVPFMEDVDFGMRLAAAGKRIELDPEIQGTHLKAWGVRSMVRTDFSGRGVPWVALLLRHRSSASTLNLGWRHRLSALASLAGLAALALRRPLALAAAAATLVALNRGFYQLLLRRRGAFGAAAGVPLHALHHLTGIAAVPFGILRHLRERNDAARSGSGPE
jgi:GT2 family glycosyltransferase